jgi:DNA-directed RNA polymerase specialized sigma24 family protein
MSAGLTAETFTSLLDYLDADRELAGEKYESLRRKLIRFFEWRGAPYPEEYADETLNRVARKLGSGTEIKDVMAYSYEVSRLVFLESTRKAERQNLPLESVNFDLPTIDTAAEIKNKELALNCLEDCLATLPSESSELIMGYYQYGDRDQVERRRALAKRSGLRRDALANRVQRLRDKLEHCVSRCLRKKTAI